MKAGEGIRLGVHVVKFTCLAAGFCMFFESEGVGWEGYLCSASALEHRRFLTVIATRLAAASNDVDGILEGWRQELRSAIPYL